MSKQGMATLLDSVLSTVSTRLSPLAASLHSADRPWLNTIFERVEKSSNQRVKREHVVAAVMGLAALYLIIGSFAQILCNAVGFAYPAYASVKALRGLQAGSASGLEEARQWLTYWVVFAAFSIADLSTFSAIPFYWLGKVCFLVYLYLPSVRGASFLYAEYLDPTLAKIEAYYGVASKSAVKPKSQ